MDLSITVAAESEIPPGNPLEKCERCGVQVQLLDTVAIIRAFLSLEPRLPLDEMWHEVRTVVGDGELAVEMRPHSPDRCTRARAGDSEPWSDVLDDED